MADEADSSVALREEKACSIGSRFPWKTCTRALPGTCQDANCHRAGALKLSRKSKSTVDSETIHPASLDMSLCLLRRWSSRPEEVPIIYQLQAASISRAFSIEQIQSYCTIASHLLLLAPQETVLAKTSTVRYLQGHWHQVWTQIPMRGTLLNLPLQMLASHSALRNPLCNIAMSGRKPLIQTAVHARRSAEALECK